jgi:hypothetical protein
MTERGGEGNDGEVSEAQGETLEDYREEINEKYVEGGEKGVSNAEEKDEPDESGRQQGNSDIANSVEVASAADSDASKAQTEQMREAQHESSGENAGTGGTKLEEGESPGKTGTEDMESMREHLNDKYPADERDVGERDKTQPPVLPEANPPESNDQQTAEACGPQNSSGRDGAQPKEADSPQQAIEGGGSKHQNEPKEANVKSTEISPSVEKVAAEVERAKGDVKNQPPPDRPPTDSGPTGGERPESHEKAPGEKPFADKENAKTTHLQGANKESGGAPTSASDRSRDRRARESSAAEPSEGASKVGMQASRLGSENRDAEAEQAGQVARVDATAYYMSSSGKIRLDLEKSSLEEATGRNLRDGDMYRIAGRVEGTSVRFEGRLSGTKGDYAYFFLNRDAEGIVPGQSYKLRIEQVERDRTFEVMRGRRGPSISVYETVLESLGVARDGQDGVVQFQVRNGRDSEVRQLYANYNSRTSWMQIPVSEIGARPGDRVEITGARRYGLEDAVADFNRQKPESLKSVSMTLEKEKLFLGVDGQRFEAKEPRLTSHGGMAALKMRIAEDGLKFQLDSKTVTPRFENSERIRGFRTIGDRLYVASDRSKIEPRTAQSTPEKVSMMSYQEMREWSKGKIKLVSSNELEGEHVLVASDEFRRLVSERLGQAGSRYKVERGNVGEILAWTMYESLGHQVAKDHPFPTIKLLGSTRDGPDFVVRFSGTGKLYYVEVKNQVNQEAATAKASREAGGFCASRPVFEREPVSGAFIVITNWNGDTPMARLHVKEVER